MSEKEKKKRSLYRKNRGKWIFAQSMIIAVLAVAILISAIVAHQLNEKYYIRYREGGSIDYNVFLKENEFYEESYLGKDQSYVASLIDNIIADLSYEIDMEAEDVNYSYSYDVTARLEIIDNTSGVAIYKPERELVSVKNKMQNSSSRLKINEIVVINYDEYNDLANKFLDTYSLPATTSSIVVTLNVNVLSDCKAFAGSAIDTYTSELRIPLTTKTVNIKMSSAVPDSEAKMIACTRGAGSEVFTTTSYVLGVIDVILILILIAFVYLTRTEDITYTAKVKKILSQYKSYIQKINNPFNARGYQLIMVDTFDEMLEIRDTIQAPILMFENADKTCAKFTIPTDSKLLYSYEIKIEGYAEPETENLDEPAPTTIIKPNITNVVRPVVKVVLNPAVAEKKEPEAEISTVVEEPEVEASEDVGTVCVSVDEELDGDLAIDDLIASIPETDEDMEIEAPNAEIDRDENSESCEEEKTAEAKEISHEKIAEVERKTAENNEDSSFKRIIRVIKRRAKRVFRAMIAPDDETEG